MLVMVPTYIGAVKVEQIQRIAKIIRDLENKPNSFSLSLHSIFILQKTNMTTLFQIHGVLSQKSRQDWFNGLKLQRVEFRWTLEEPS